MGVVKAQLLLLVYNLYKAISVFVKFIFYHLCILNLLRISETDETCKSVF